MATLRRYVIHVMNQFSALAVTGFCQIKVNFCRWIINNLKSTI